MDCDPWCRSLGDAAVPALGTLCSKGSSTGTWAAASTAARVLLENEVPDPSCTEGGLGVITTLDTSRFVLFVSKGLVFVQGMHVELSLPRLCAPHGSRYGWFPWVHAGAAVTHCSHGSHCLGMCSPGTRYCCSACKELNWSWSCIKFLSTFFFFLFWAWISFFGCSFPCFMGCMCHSCLLNTSLLEKFSRNAVISRSGFIVNSSQFSLSV